jgi:hypothetical protein
MKKTIISSMAMALLAVDAPETRAGAKAAEKPLRQLSN